MTMDQGLQGGNSTMRAFFCAICPAHFGADFRLGKSPPQGHGHRAGDVLIRVAQ